MRVCISPRGGGSGKNWDTITQGQDKSVANVYFSGAFQNDDDEVTPNVLGLTAFKGYQSYPAVFISNPWGSVIAHEMGHLLGSLEHNFVDENNLMYYGVGKPNPNAVLTQDQINQMRTSTLLREQ
jgi:hypothetical protein